MKKKVLIVSNTDWFFLLHRLEIANALKEKGFDVFVLTNDSGKCNEIEKLGFSFIQLKIDRKSTNPFLEFKTLYELFKVYKKIKPDMVYQVTIKPIIYGLFVSKILNIQSVNTICGLGYVFSEGSPKLLKYIVSKLYKTAFREANTYTFFENRNDLDTFRRLDVFDDDNFTQVVNGAGVDLKKFYPCKRNAQNKKINIVLPTRMLWDKGIIEFIEAAKLLKSSFQGEIFFKLYGMIDCGNKQSVPEEYLNKNKIEGYLEWLGFQEDMVECYTEADIVVLPSYYGEGLPTVLAEACAMGLPIVTTDSVGCRECVDEGVNGFKVEVKSVSALAQAIEKLILDKDLRLSMGKASREKAIKDFDQKKIVAEYVKVFNLMVEN